jgi:4-hydroxy-tetrahydrodipicolinate synthase
VVESILYLENFMIKDTLSGVYAAAITPLNSNLSPDLAAIPHYLDFLAQRGCHGALILGTTGEGPSFEAQERIAIFKAATKVRSMHPNFRLLAGTGTPSLAETALLSKSAFDLGYQGVVVLPPYYFHQATDEGLYDWFRTLIHRAAPEDGTIFGYHFPAQARVGFSLDLLVRLRDSFPNQFVGIKDSTSTSEYAVQTQQVFDDEFVILVGNDRNLSKSIENGAAGCITALANLESPNLRAIWEQKRAGESADQEQAQIDAKRSVLEKYPPNAASIKAILSKQHDFPHWPVRPPLTPIEEDRLATAVREMDSADIAV